MSDYRHIQIRRGTSEEWTSANPVLNEGEIGYDSTLHKLKVGDGENNWSDLPYCDVDVLEVIDSLTSDSATAALSANQGRELKSQLDALSAGIPPGVTIIDNLTSTETTSALSANQGRELKSLIDNLEDATEVIDGLESDSGTAALSAKQGKVLNAKIRDASLFGMGYDVLETNNLSKPTKIKFEDGITCDLTWNDTVLQKITASTGEVMTMKYNVQGTIIGRTVTRP
mgnify:CR=1 FL=1